ncbi:MAG: glycosyltransferase [Clostridia bacterium]|nr:glycosyltransferase [Clostridia bacterium]
MIKKKEQSEKSISKKTLIVNYFGLQIGGIETYLAKLIQHSTQNGYRVIWLTNKLSFERCYFKDIISHPLVEIVYIKGNSISWYPHKKISFASSEHVTMISMDIISFMKAEKIRRYAKVEEFNHILALPHFTGIAYYPERAFRTKLGKKYWTAFVKNYVKELVEKDCIRAYSLKHLDYYEKNYGVKIDSKEEKVLKKINYIKDYDDSYFIEKANSRVNNFTIVTCGRFDFPHKGYILGLLDDFVELKEKYNNLKLVIIGYGPDEHEVLEKIAKMSKATQESIELVGAVSPFDLSRHFEKGHLNIGLAGALFDGAICALPSLCTRHYSRTCETYGYIHEMEGTYLREDPANPIKPYIERLIKMSNDDYIELTKKCFERAKSVKTNDPEYIFNQKNKNNKSTLRGIKLFKAKVFNALVRLIVRIFKLRILEDEEK